MSTTGKHQRAEAPERRGIGRRWVGILLGAGLLCAVWAAEFSGVSHAEVVTVQHSSSYARISASRPGPVPGTATDPQSAGVNRTADGSGHIFGQPELMQSGWDIFGFEKDLAIAQFEKEPPRRSFPFLPGEDDTQSVSVGTVTDGYLVNGVALPDVATLAILPRQRARHLDYGTAELMEMLQEASTRLAARYEGNVIQLGNVGRHYGGDIPYSVSHNSGRDADVAFLATDPDGEPALLPDLLRFDESGHSVKFNGYYRFDAERNWALVRALVLSSKSQIQYLFISNGLKRILLDYARESGADAGVIARAQVLLRQPGAAIPHDDHLHVRVYCSRFDSGAGCHRTGAVHSGVELFSGEDNIVIGAAIEALKSADPRVREVAIRRLTLIGGQTESESEVALLLTDSDVGVRKAAISAMVTWGSSSLYDRLDEIWAAEQSSEVKTHLLQTLARTRERHAISFLIGLLDEPELATDMPKPFDLRLAAVDALTEARSLSAIAALIPLLQEPSTELRARAARSLRMLTNYDIDSVEWRNVSVETEAIETASAAWSRWLAETRYRRWSYAEWTRAGFEEAGYTMDTSDAERAQQLARASGDSRDYIRVNAQQALMSWSSNFPRSLDWSRSDARTYWTRWVARNPYRFR